MFRKYFFIQGNAMMVCVNNLPRMITLSLKSWISLNQIRFQKIVTTCAIKRWTFFSSVDQMFTCVVLNSSPIARHSASVLCPRKWWAPENYGFNINTIDYHWLIHDIFSKCDLLADVCVVVVGPDVGLVVVGVAIVGLDVGLGLAVVGVVVVGLDVGVALLYKLQIKKFLNGQSMEGDLLQQLQLLLVAPGRWHHCHPLMRNRRLGRKSDSCWQSTVSSKSWKGIEVLLFWYCRSTEQEARANNIARLIRNISCTRYRTCLLW